MSLFDLTAILIALAALFSFINARYIKLPTTIGVMLMSLVVSLAVIGLGKVGISFRGSAAALVAGIDFQRVLLHGMLAFLLFAGSLTMDLEGLLEEWRAIGLLAIVGTALSTVLIGGLSWQILKMSGLPVPLAWCLVFGALISPTDPIAILGILKHAGAPPVMETQIAGESLFNDGIAVVLFIAMVGIATDPRPVAWGSLGLVLLWQAAGGVAVGLASGFLVYQLLKRIDDYKVEVLLTLALAMGAYSLAESIGVSAPIAVVIAGLFVGNRGRHFAMSVSSRDHVDTFWELIDEIMNAVLFLLIGLVVMVMPFERRFIWMACGAIILTLLVRWALVWGLVAGMRRFRQFERGTVSVLTWGGLRGGLSVAMALSIPNGPYRNLLVAATYCVAVFSVFVQGLSAGRVIRWATHQG